MRSLLLLPVLVACTNMPADPTKMSAEQLKEWVKDKNAYVTCASAKNMSGNVTLMSANLDKGTVVGGTVTVSPDCTTTITSDPKPKTP
jgi:cell division septation protein DedD